ncbi:hypothetical protein [Microseira wollei]|uniref:Uncharacterized protein n=1 Tax=Microseira wollei NIES-4236 TaxID=2530354 RepID=A0AAV3XL90_9CYAN|nr:hypothetical protein [Microseira wollei]GET40287.1 hypothetical protein MiSe_50960 [Microseira wollei NIES-4236]
MRQKPKDKPYQFSKNLARLLMVVWAGAIFVPIPLVLLEKAPARLAITAQLMIWSNLQQACRLYQDAQNQDNE